MNAVTVPAAPSVGLSWLVRWRWVVAATAGTAALAARSLGWGVQGAPLIGLALLLVASNVVLWRWSPTGATATFGVLAFDTLLLTGFLAFSGGPTNPFSILYMVQTTLAAVVLGSRWTWPIVVLSVVCFGALFAVPSQATMEHHGHHGGYSQHLYGMFAAFAVAAAAITYLVTRIARALRVREAQLAEARELAARAEHMAALTTLAAGAAHELGTPLGTIAIAANELAHAAESIDSELAEDARLIREEVKRCRQILDQMNAEAAEAGGEPLARVEVVDLLAQVASVLPEASRKRLRLEAETAGSLEVPLERTARVLSDLVDNAFHASPPGAEVVLAARREGDAVVFAVSDVGEGMDAVVLRRACEPFFTTKPVGEGMGLGLFLARALAERLGGRLDIESSPGGGTTTTFVVPFAPPFLESAT